MADEQRQSEKSEGVSRKLVKTALAPIVARATTAAVAYLTRKAKEAWEQKLQPKIREEGGVVAAARASFEDAADKVGGPASGKVSDPIEKVGREGDEEDSAPAESSSSSDSDREQDRRRREQRRRARRQALEQAGSRQGG